MLVDTFIYYCSECELGLQLEEDYDGPCPCCGEFQLELIDQDNEAQCDTNETKLRQAAELRSQAEEK